MEIIHEIIWNEIHAMGEVSRVKLLAHVNFALCHRDLNEIGDRRLRSCIAEMINAGYLIGSKSNDGGGYFEINDEKGLERACAEMKCRIRKEAVRMTNLHKAYRHKVNKILPGMEVVK